MPVAAISEVKAKLSEYVARARAGDEVVITDRGRPVARLVAAERSEPALAELERRGIVRGRRQPLPDDFLDRPRPRPTGESTLSALLEEREEGR